jgi:winged helix DNA-binding protein
LTPSTIRRERLRRQQIASRQFERPADLVRWMGAVQAQDVLAGIWAIGLRVQGGTEAAVEAAIAGRKIVRTWPMRGTLHFVHAADARWMLGLLTPRVIARAAGRHRELELDGPTFARARTLLTRALRDGRRLTRPQAYDVLDRGGVSPRGQRGIHILGHLSQQRVLCFGPREGRQPTFVLLDEWLPAATSDPPREQALAMLAERYFASHGPATMQDFAWWSGLTTADAQTAIGAAGSRLDTEAWKQKRWWRSAAAVVRGARGSRAVLLPPWDEYLVGYRDRSLAAASSSKGRDPAGLIGTPVIVIDGQVHGTWKRSLARATARVVMEAWTRVTAGDRRALLEAAAGYGDFLGRAIEVRWGRAGNPGE